MDGRVSIPHGMLSLAGSLEHAGHKVVIVDENLGQKLPRNYDYIGVGALTDKQILSAIDVCNRSDAVKIWGGWHPTMVPEQTAYHPEVDIVVRGQGECTIVDILDGVPLHSIPGITYMHNDKVVSNPDRPVTPISQLPRPAWHLISLRDYVFRLDDRKLLTYISSQGCPYRCGFCEVCMVKPKWTALDPEVVWSDMEHYSVYCDTVLFDDSIFPGASRMLSLGEGMTLDWTVKTRADIVSRITDDDLKKIRSMGCFRVMMGIESGSDSALRRINKGVTVQQVKHAISRLTKLGFDLSLTFMFCMPGDTPNDIDMTLKLVRSLMLRHPSIHIGLNYYTPYPGTPLYEESKRCGFVEPASLEEWASMSWRRSDYPWVDDDVRKKVERLRHKRSLMQHVQGFSRVFRK